MAPATSMRIRAAYPREIGTLVGFNCSMALETEGRELDAARVRAGVEAVFSDPSRGTYYVALREEDPVGALLVTSEWSDWRNGLFWWIQSVYVTPAARRTGVFTALYEHVSALARDDARVCGIRLYVERDNQRAQTTYANLGMLDTGYRVMEADFTKGIKSYA